MYVDIGLISFHCTSIHVISGTSMLDLIETLFARYGIQSLRYDGKMTREAREVVIARFRKPGGPKVILIRLVDFYL